MRPAERRVFVLGELRTICFAPSGAPAPLDAPAWADLRFVDFADAGGHVPIVAEVTAVGARVDQLEVLTRRELGLQYGGYPVGRQNYIRSDFGDLTVARTAISGR